MSGRRLSLHHLTQVLELGDVDDVRSVLAEHHADVAGLLGLESEPDLSSVNVGDVDRLRRRCAEVRRFHRARLLRAREQRAHAAAQRLTKTAGFMHDHVSLEVGELLGDLLIHPSAKYVQFTLSESEAVAVGFGKLKEVRRAVGFSDLTAHVDAHGLHFRWRRDVGGLSFYPVAVPSDDEDRVLHVDLVPAVTPSDLDEGHHRQPRHRQGAWLGDVLAELGLL